MGPVLLGVLALSIVVTGCLIARRQLSPGTPPVHGVRGQAAILGATRDPFRSAFVFLCLILCTAGTFATLHAGYYLTSFQERPDHRSHDLLEPVGPLGLLFGFAATTLASLNLLYLVRRFRITRKLLRALRLGLDGHMLSGVTALLLALLHAGLEPRHAPGGHALLVLAALVASGATTRFLAGRALRRWRAFHRFLAITMALLLTLHIVSAYRYATW